MTLRDRIVVSLLAIAVLLVLPAIYGLFALRELRQVAQDLRARDAVSALAVGRLQTAYGETENWERIYLALATQDPADRAEAKARVASNVERAEAELRRLVAAGYGAEATPALQQWVQVRQAIAREQALVEAGQIELADTVRSRVVDPAFAAVDSALDPISAAINRAGEAQVSRAQEIATRAATTTLAALAVALAAALIIAGWLTGSLVRPIQELRRGMAVVAGGDFDPHLRIATDRADELGDLAHSFRRMTRQLAELDRLKAEFVSIASHELKTPLSVIRGYVSLLQDGIYGEVAEPQRPVLGSVADQTDRLARLIQQLLDISRLEAGGGRLEPNPFDLGAFLQELKVSFDALAQQNQIDFELETTPDLPATLIGDADRLNEVIGNLLSNAFKFTPRGGRIRLRAARSEGQVAVEVADTGVGIPHDQLTRVFEKFYQVDNEAQPRSVGTGLGLAIAREIVEAHQGTIRAESQLGKGTVFRVALPEDAPASQNSRP